MVGSFSTTLCSLRTNRILATIKSQRAQGQNVATIAASLKR